MKIMKKIIASVIATSLVTLITFGYGVKAKGINNQKVSEKINVEEVMNNISYFSETIGERFAGSSKEKESAEYIYNYFEGLGYEMELQEVPMANKRGFLSVNENELDNIMAYRTVGTFGEEYISGDIIDCNLGSVDDIPEEINNNIGIIKKNKDIVKSIKNAVNLGAKGIAVYNDTEGSFRISLGDYKCPIPVVLIPKDRGEALVEEINTSNEVVITGSIGQAVYDKTWNVIATKKAKDVENPEILHVTAHYDTVAGSPGANDNASGAAMLMELGKVFSDYETKKEVRFVAFGAEEIGLLGSKYYVNNLTNNEKARSLGNINMDMIGTNYEECTQLAIETVDGKEHSVTDGVLNAGKQLGKDNYFVSKYGGSDHVSFHNAGIDEVTFIWVIPNTNDDGTEPWYHTYEDTIDKISPERLQEMGELISTSIFDLVGAYDKNIVVSKINNLESSEVTNNIVKLTWNTPNNEIGLSEYIVYKDGKKFAKVPSETKEFVVDGLRANTIYGFKVTAKYSNGEESKPESINIRTKK